MTLKKFQGGDADADDGYDDDADADDESTDGHEGWNSYVDVLFMGFE